MFGLFDFIFESVPSNRSTYCAYILLKGRDSSDTAADGQIKGAYVQGFYQLAKEDGLRCQVEREKFKSYNAFQEAHPDLYKQLYHKPDAEGKVFRKNAFELAIVPEINEEDILKTIRREYNYQNEQGLLPQSVFKVQMVKEWLGSLDQTDFEAAGPMSGATVTLNNPDAQQKGKEKFLHSTMQFLGFFSTIKTFFNCGIPFLLFMSFSTLTPVAALAASVSMVFLFKVLHLSDFFGFSDMAEVLWNDLRWLTSKHFLNSKSPFSFKKAMLSACFLLAIGAFAAVCAQGTFFGVLALLTPTVLEAGIAANALAGVLAGLSFMGTCIGMMLPLRYMHGFGIFDNTIPVDIIKKSFIPDLKETKLAPSLLAKPPAKEKRKDVKLQNCRAELAVLKNSKKKKKAA